MTSPDSRLLTGIQNRISSFPGFQEHCIYGNALDRSALAEIDLLLQKEQASLAGLFLFGNLTHCKLIAAETEKRRWPVLSLESAGPNSSSFPSFQAVAISGAAAIPVVWEGRNVGLVWNDAQAKYCRLCGILPDNLKLSRDEQTRSVFEIVTRILEQNQFAFSDTVRTWFYLDRLLEWYEVFNRVRTEFFREHRIFDGLVPASTGIGSANPQGSAISAGLLAVRPQNEKVRAVNMPSPLQNSAQLYRSSFSRAVELSYPNQRHLYVSGTASINQAGESAFARDPARQIEFTMKVVERLLQSRRMDWNNVTRAIAYCKNFPDIPLFGAYCTERQLPDFPMTICQALICRQDLLFEIEIDAVGK